MKRKNILALLCACLGAASLQAQEAERQFTEKLGTVSVATETIESDFSLTRTMSFMAEDVTGRGRFYYLRGEGISLEFTEPAGDEITMGRRAFRITSGGKSQTVRSESNPMLRSLQRMLTACMTGDIEALREGASLTFSDTGVNFVVTITPEDRRAKNMMKLITLSFEKENMSLDVLRMEETSGDVSEYRFYNKVFNKGVDAARFDVQ